MEIRFCHISSNMVFGFLPALISAATPTRAANRAISAESCVLLACHSPAPDVAYKPGVDVHGKPVAPADLPSAGGFTAPETLSIPITVDMAPHFGLSRGDRWLEAETLLGTVVYRDGQAWYNGQSLSADALAVLSQICRRIGNRDGSFGPRR